MCGHVGQSSSSNCCTVYKMTLLPALGAISKAAQAPRLPCALHCLPQPAGRVTARLLQCLICVKKACHRDTTERCLPETQGVSAVLPASQPAQVAGQYSRLLGPEATVLEKPPQTCSRTTQIVALTACCSWRKDHELLSTATCTSCCAIKKWRQTVQSDWHRAAFS